MSQPTTTGPDAHVAVLAFPFGTHAAPLLSIISRLAASAPHTHFSFFNTQESNNSLLSTHKHYFVPNLKACHVSNGVPQGYVLTGNTMENIELFMKAAPDNLRKAVAAAEAETGRKVSCLVNDSFLWFTSDMAAEMEVPWVPCWLSGSNSLSAHVHTDLIRDTLGVEVSQRRSFQSNISTSQRATRGALPWLDRQKPASVVYIGFGSVSILSPDELLAVAEALEARKVPFIWSLKKSLQEGLPKGFLERTKSDGIVVSWAPQLDVLAHNAVGVFVNHAGWNSALESIGSGVPMICRPFFGDHTINAKMIEAVWEVGITVDGGFFTKAGLLRCLDLILSQEKGKKIRENVRNIKHLTEKAIGVGGSSTKNLKALVDIVSRPS
uniref:UDP-glycosyltransferase 4 n=1 Tax=Litchi chinensis TaxID=151069 RepID=W8G334_LITCN|nr:UDP-glycosyltransferase 4 [Litchi chinensis]